MTYEIARPEELDLRLATAAHEGTSFEPDKRGKQEQEGFANDINAFAERLLALAQNDDQKRIAAEEIQRYKESYLKVYGKVLASKSRCMSTMIAGPSKFPVARNQKRLNVAMKRTDEFLEWHKKAQSAACRRVLDARTPEEKQDARWQDLKKDLERSLLAILQIDEQHSPFTRSAFVNSIVGKIQRLADNGEVDLVAQSLELVRAYNRTHSKPALTWRHGFWQLEEDAKRMAARRQNAGPETLYDQNGIRIATNPDIDRLQIFFPGKPPEALRAELKRSGWHWSPREGAWQRQLTANARHNATYLIQKCFAAEVR